MKDAYYIDDTEANENYGTVLRGPNGFECHLGEPEDRTWGRDGADAVKRLNTMHHALEMAYQELFRIAPNSTAFATVARALHHGDIDAYIERARHDALERLKIAFVMGFNWSKEGFNGECCIPELCNGTEQVTKERAQKFIEFAESNVYLDKETKEIEQKLNDLLNGRQNEYQQEENNERA